MKNKEMHVQHKKALDFETCNSTSLLPDQVVLHKVGVTLIKNTTHC